MKESVLDILMYLFENYSIGEYADVENQSTLQSELVGAGFPEEEILHAFHWLDGLTSAGQLPLPFAPSRSIRVYAKEELNKLGVECRGFLLYLEQLGILSPQNRELVIERLLALEEEVDLERVKWVVLLVLVNQPGTEEEAIQVEDMVYYTGDWLH